jgi:hypothetical protein
LGKVDTNRFERSHVAYMHDGYVFPRPGESKEKAFVRGKEELLEVLKRQLEVVESLTFEEFEKYKKNDFSPR